MLFIEGQQGRGLLSFTQARQSCPPLREKARPLSLNRLLGLNAIISNHPYEVTAEMMEPRQASFIPSDALLKFLHDYGEVALRVAQQLSHNYYSAHDEILTLGLTNPRGKGLPNCCWAGLRNGEIQTILYTCIWC